MKLDEFEKELKLMGIELTPAITSKLNLYYDQLILWNEKMNLTAITNKEEVFLKHFYDSLTITKTINLKENFSLCDIGSGAGFPGVILKIFYPNLKVTLVDSLNKRVEFLNNLINELKLTDIIAIHSRAEDYAINNREKFDIVTVRAVAKLNVLIELCLPIVKINGSLIAMKANADSEIIESANALKELGGEIKEISKFQLPQENSNRCIINILKIFPTEKKYPRKFDKIKQKPL